MTCKTCYDTRTDSNLGFVYVKDKNYKHFEKGGVDACHECAETAETEYLTRGKDDDK